ncbi:MAG: hypothetical protein ACR2N0_07390 [Rubrobacteraceae bacterium]
MLVALEVERGSMREICPGSTNIRPRREAEGELRPVEGGMLYAVVER